MTARRTRDAVDEEIDRVFDGPPLPLGGRPTETVSGIGLAGSVYGFLTQAGVPPAAAAIIAVLVAFVPLGVSKLVDARRRQARQVGRVHRR